MTIGIAAAGPWAGAGVLTALRAVEAVGRGAIGGFVSLAALTSSQDLLRAETQTGGVDSLFPDAPPDAFLSAPFAALISSGPNRPEPLSQFIAAEPGIGIVTGHRFPHATTAEGQALNTLVLDAMEQGRGAQDAVDDVIAAHPKHDAGFVALPLNGALGMGNMPSVLRLANRGEATSECPRIGARVAALHNAILPNKAIATVATEIALDEMRRRNTKVQTITVLAGIDLGIADQAEIHVDDTFKAIHITHPDARHQDTETAFGIGDHVNVFRLGKLIGRLGLEPFMIVKDGTIVSLDGAREVQLPVHLDDAEAFSL